MHLPTSDPSRGFKHDKRTAYTVHLTTLWSRISRTQTIPEDVDIDKLYVAIRDRLRDPEWEVRLHALRVLAELLPISKNALAFPFDQVVNNLGHNSPTVRKAALDALKVFCVHCEEPECALRAIVDRCNYDDSNKRLLASELESNIITGLILSIPSVMAILKKRCESLDTYPVVLSLGLKLFDAIHRDVSLRSMIKLRYVCGTSNFMESFSKLNPQIQDKFRVLCEVYDDDSFDVHYGPRRGLTRIFQDLYSEGSDDSGSTSNIELFSNKTDPVFTKEVSSDESQKGINEDIIEHGQDEISGKVIIETEITFDSDTAITMTLLEENETEPETDRNYASDGYDSCSSDKNTLRTLSDTESEDTDVVISTHKRVRFGGEMVKIRTPDSDNLLASEEDSKSASHNESDPPIASFHPINEITTIQEVPTPQRKKPRKSGIPLPVISKSDNSLRHLGNVSKINERMIKRKSKSLSELYDYFRTKNKTEYVSHASEISVQVNEPHASRLKLDFREISKSQSGFALSVTESIIPEKLSSPVEPHREVEVLHNLQRSPTRSPRSQRLPVHLDQDGFVLSVLRSSPERSPDLFLLDPLGSSPHLQQEYEWEKLNAVPHHIMEQLHNTENWISAVRAADQLHRALLDPKTVRTLEVAGTSLAEHMWELGSAVGAARAPAESAVCALLRAASPAAARRMLPTLLKRLVRTPPSAALPHALLARLTLPQLIDLIFDSSMTGVEKEEAHNAQLHGAWCVARAAGPAAVLAAVRRRLIDEPHADYFCDQLRKRLRRPTDNLKPLPEISRASQLPLPVLRRRARSTPPPAPRVAPRRLRPIADSAPLAGASYPVRDLLIDPLFPILHKEKDSSAQSIEEENIIKYKNQEVVQKETDSQKSFVSADHITEISTQGKPRSETTSPSICVEDFSERADDEYLLEEGQRPISEEKRSMTEEEQPMSQHTNDRSPSVHEVDGHTDNMSGSQASLPSDRMSMESLNTRAPSPVTSRTPLSNPTSRVSTPRSPSPATLHPSSANSIENDCVADVQSAGHDVRSNLAACIAIPKPQEDWETIVRRLQEIEVMALDPTARAPAASWRAVTRATATHVRSLRSRVARTACCTLGSLFEARGKILDPETEEAAGALLDRAADANRFLRGDAEEALTRVACGVTAARATTALAKRGATHRAGPVRAAAACALAELVIRGGAARALDLSSEPRALLLRAAVDLLGDASPDARAHARRLCVALAEDSRFRPLLKDTLPASKYKSVEKSVDRLRSR